MIEFNNKIQTRHKVRNQRRWKFILILIGFLLVIGIIALFVMANWPMWQDRSRSISAAERTERVHDISNFYSADVNRIYYTVNGSRDGKRYYVIMNRRYHPVRVINSAGTVNRAYVLNKVKSHHDVKKIFNVAPTIFNGKAAWVVSYEDQAGKPCYHTFRIQNGRSIQLIKNL